MRGAECPTRCGKQRHSLYVTALAMTAWLAEPRSPLVHQALARSARSGTAALSRLHTSAHLEYCMKKRVRPKLFCTRWVPKSTKAYVTACCCICLLDPGHHIVVPRHAGCRKPDPVRQAAPRPIRDCSGNDRWTCGAIRSVYALVKLSPDQPAAAQLSFGGSIQVRT